MEQLDQEWIEQNIDKIMKEFLIINPEFNKKDRKTYKQRNYHKNRMLQDMDSPTYRPYYYILKRFPEIKARINKKKNRFYNEAKENEKQIKVWKSKYEYAEKKINEYCGEKSYEYQIAFGIDPKLRS